MKNLVIIIPIVLFLSACVDQSMIDEAVTITSEDVATLSDAQYKNAGIEIGKIETQEISSVLKLNGKVEVSPQNRVSVSVPLGGYLKSTKLLPGMQIKKGETIAVMEDPQYIQLQEDYLTAKAQFEFTKNEYLRQKELNESKAVSDKVFEQTKASYETQNVLIKSLEQKLRMIGLNPQSITPNTITRSVSIPSPINGFVAAVNVNVGKYVTPSDVLFELVNPEDANLLVTVFDKDVSKLSVGQKVEAYSNSNPDKKYKAEIGIVSKTLSNDNATQVYCQFKEYDKELLPGMFMNVNVELSGHNAPVLPDDAIVRFENKNYIFIESGTKEFKLVEVQIGNTENGFTEIIDAEKIAQKNIAVKGAYNLLMMLKNTEED